MSFSLIVGLGNPGRQYEHTRHNIGFMVVDRLALAAGVAFRAELKWQCHMARLPDDGAWLVKPQTFMNLSGRSVAQVLGYYKLTPQQMLVVYDDAALPFGSLRFREKGSAGGHNGIKSLIEHLGTHEFPRLKLGIGASQPGALTHHVLGTFSGDERAQLENTLATAVKAVQLARSQGVASAANLYHIRIHPPLSDESQIPGPDRP